MLISFKNGFIQNELIHKLTLSVGFSVGLLEGDLVGLFVGCLSCKDVEEIMMS